MALCTCIHACCAATDVRLVVEHGNTLQTVALLPMYYCKRGGTRLEYSRRPTRELLT